MNATLQQPEGIDCTKVFSNLDRIRDKIKELPEDLRKDLFLECSLLEDFCKDKCLRSKFRHKKVENKKPGGSFFLVGK